MEIKLTDRQKIFLEGIARSCVFLVALRELFLFVLMFFVGPCVGAILFLFTLIPDIGNVAQHKPNDFEIALVLSFLAFSFTIPTNYVIAKFCGIHKYFSQFKFWKSFIILIAMSILAYYFCCLDLHTFKFDFETEAMSSIIAVIGLVPAYLTYLFFNFLTKKFPTPFEQIGYFFSNQFYIDMFRKIQEKCKKDCALAQSF